MSVFGPKLWWNDESLKEELTAKAETGSWLIVANNIPGRVLRIVYAGYKIKLPNDTEIIVNPDTLGGDLKDITTEEYVDYVAAWQVKEDLRLQNIHNIELARLAKLEQQRLCKHSKVTTYQVVRAPGCDINDTYCCICEKILRRSWSTASDRDPDDHVSDWDWWHKECILLYKQAPNRVDYVVVEQIDDDYPHFVRQPKPVVPEV